MIVKGMKRVRRVALCVAVAGALVAAQSATASAVTGGVFAVGQNNFEQLGDGTEENRDLPVAVSGLSDVVSVDGHQRGGLALLGDGTVMAWGANEAGQLGNGTTEPSATPTPVGGLKEVVAISAYGKTCLALLADGTVMAWGANSHGQLGNGTTESSHVPVAVEGLSGVVAIAAGEAHSLALLESGEVMAWGSDVHGQLGNGGSADSHIPIALTGLSGVTAIAAGAEHSLALTSGGGVWAWGANGSGQLGVGSTTDSNVPVAVSGLSSGVVSVSAGGHFSLALRADGSEMSWGADEFGQLGIGVSGKEAHSATPVAVNGIGQATAISAGEFSSLALLASKRVAAWGGDEFGQLGIGEEGPGQNSPLPVLVCGLMEAGGVSAGNLANYFYGVTSTMPCPQISEVSPKVGTQNGGTTVTITGSGFSSVSAVDFGTAAASSFTVNSTTSITAVSPAMIAPPGNGFVEIRVTTPAGTSPEAGLGLFGYEAPPTITHVRPAKGPASGGTTVTIEGTGYTGENHELQSVKFGSLPATSFGIATVKGRKVVTAVAPDRVAGAADVTLTTQWGTSAKTKADQFKYEPVISSVSPSSGGVAGGSTVTVTGAGFAIGANLTVFKFGSTKAKSANCASTSECAVLVPAHAAATVDVRATANKVTSKVNSPADHFTYG